MDYEAMSTPQLQQECKRRGLPSGRAKAELVSRLTAADSGADPAAQPETSVEAEPERVVHEAFLPSSDPNPAPAAPERVTAAANPAPGLPTVFRLDFPACSVGPSEDQHAAFRAATRQAALDAGRSPRGDAHRVGTTNGREVYEISVRRVT